MIWLVELRQVVRLMPALQKNQRLGLAAAEA